MAHIATPEKCYLYLSEDKNQPIVPDQYHKIIKMINHCKLNDLACA